MNEDLVDNDGDVSNDDLLEEDAGSPWFSM